MTAGSGHASRASRAWFYWLTPVVSVLLAGALVELGLALFYPVPFSIEHNMYFEPDPLTGFRLKPNSIGHFQGGIVGRANAHGHRDDWVPVQRTPGRYRILALGDSFTVGASVAQEEAYPEVLESLLNESRPPAEVINAGVGGWDPFQYAQYYEHYGRAFEPDLIVIGVFVGNDAYSRVSRVEQTRTAVMGRRVRRAVADQRLLGAKIRLYQHSHLARALLNRQPQDHDVTRDHCAQFTPQYLRIQGNRLLNHAPPTRRMRRRARANVGQIIRIRDLAAVDSIPVIAVLIPDEIQINADLQRRLMADHEGGAFDFDLPQTMLTELFGEAGIPVVDLLPHFRNDPRCLYMNDTHWTAAGHQLAATVIHRRLVPLITSSH